jgi:hypothetical protein
MQSIQGCPDEQIQDQECCELVEIANEAFWRQPPQAEQRKPAPQIPEQSGAQAVKL